MPAGLMTMSKAAVSVEPRVTLLTLSAFVARTTIPENVPPAVGVPLRTPALERFNPGGRVPDWTAYVGAGFPSATKV